MSAVLETSAVSVNFGGVHALINVDLAVGEGQLVGADRPQRRGKTTFIDGVTGFVACTGKAVLDGADLSGCLRTRGPAAAWRARGRASSCSTT